MEFFNKVAEEDESWEMLGATLKLANTTRVTGRLIYHILNDTSAKELRKVCLKQLAEADDKQLALLPGLRDRARMAVRMQLP